MTHDQIVTACWFFGGSFAVLGLMFALIGNGNGNEPSEHAGRSTESPVASRDNPGLE